MNWQSSCGPTNREHAGEIQTAYGYTDFTDPDVLADLGSWLHARISLASERPGMLFDLATARLPEAKVLLPGVTVLSRLVAAAREQATIGLWQTLAGLNSPTQKRRLASILTVPSGERTSGLDRLRRGPTSLTATGLLGALQRIAEIRALGVSDIDLTGVAPGRLPHSPGTPPPRKPRPSPG